MPTGTQDVNVTPTLESTARIRQLSPDVVNKIAAGEVIERPASVVKELLENSVDALASRIDLEIEQGGVELIRIVDDGEGIHADDLELAVTSHATSKIESADDLFRVHTMGFRGEALASIAAVSRFRIRSRQADAECGYELNIDGGVAEPIKPCGCPPGTSIEVRRLLGNTPVRRKFLRTAPTEFGHISEQFTRIALANPRLHLSLRHNARKVHELPGSGDLLDRIERFQGRELVEQLIPVDSESDGVRLWGYVAHPSQSKGTRKGQYLFLNGRYIQDRSLQHALGEAYRGILMTGRFPIAFLFLEMPPDEVDVNVHPTKAEVRFRDGQRLYRQLLSSLRNKFLTQDLDSTISLPKQGIPKPVSPEQQSRLQLDFAKWAKEELAAALAPMEAEADGEDGGQRTEDRDQKSEVRDQRSEESVVPSDQSPATSHQSPTTSPPLSPSPPLPVPPPPRVMQVHDCYLVIESEDGLTVIDQHALHERILYEQLRERVLAGEVESQKMLVPDPIELPADEAAALFDRADLLAELGYALEEFGGNTLLLSAYPAMLPKADHHALLKDLASQLVADMRGSQEAKYDRRDLLDSLLHMMSCKAAIKAGQRLTPEEMDALLAQRHLVENSHHCPHGRPTALVLSRQELDRQFGRLG